MCKECFYVFCKIPNYCKYCNLYLLNDMYLSHLKINEYIQLPFENKFTQIFKLYNDKREIEFNNFTLLLKDFIHNYYSTKLNKNPNELNEDEIDLSSLHNIKAIILFRKYGKRFIYSNIEKNTYSSDMNNFLIKNQYNLLKENLTCSGCEYVIDKAQIKILSNFKNFYLCENCNEVYCM